MNILLMNILLLPSLAAVAVFGRVMYSKYRDKMKREDTSSQVQGFPYRLKLTYYYIYPAKAGDFPILSGTGKVLGLVTKKSYTNMVLEGTGQLPDGRLANITMDTTMHPQYGKLYTFSIVDSARGAKGMKLIPFESVAVDRDVFPIGTKLFIKELNKTVVAMDTGNLIKGYHIDYFIGHKINEKGLKLPGYVHAAVVS
jgi:3D (Asp-Asp-Asp) domain-containing protein